MVSRHNDGGIATAAAWPQVTICVWVKRRPFPGFSGDNHKTPQLKNGWSCSGLKTQAESKILKDRRVMWKQPATLWNLCTDEDIRSQRLSVSCRTCRRRWWTAERPDLCPVRALIQQVSSMFLRLLRNFLMDAQKEGKCDWGLRGDLKTRQIATLSVQTENSK